MHAGACLGSPRPACLTCIIRYLLGSLTPSPEAYKWGQTLLVSEVEVAASSLATSESDSHKADTRVSRILRTRSGCQAAKSPDSYLDNHLWR